MKFTPFAAVIAFTFGAAIAAETAAELAAAVGPAPRAGPSGDSFEKRIDCGPSPLCFCEGGIGPFCGNETINPFCSNSHAYSCASGGYTCDLGENANCAQCGELSC